MNIFFTASLRAKSKSIDDYRQIYKIANSENVVFAEHILDLNLSQVRAWNPEFHFEYYQNLLSHIKEADILIAETTQESINVWYEVSLAIQQKKHVILLYKNKEISNMLENIEESLAINKVQLIQYTKHNLQKQLSDALEFAKQNIDQRFTMLLPTHLINYLDYINETQNIPRSVFIRSLIEEHLEKNSDSH